MKRMIGMIRKRKLSMNFLFLYISEAHEVD